jgi:hypothetical protein
MSRPKKDGPVFDTRLDVLLPANVVQAIEDTAARQFTTKSQLARQCIIERFGLVEQTNAGWDRGTWNNAKWDDPAQVPVTAPEVTA